ncbi:MAG: ABC transporter ATP-binding protein [Phycisphaerae bacterium]
MTDGDAIFTDRLCKQYGSRRVLQDLSLRVGMGELFGFLGPNGAGKTTTIRIIMGLLRATSGVARLLGGDAWGDGPRLRAGVGYLPGDVRFYDTISGRRTMDFFDHARGGTHGEEARRLTQVFDLELDKPVRSYSRGMKQKLGLIVAMMHKPKLLVLDEPTTGLDPLVREALYRELRAVAGDGRTVLFSSHTLSEVEELCDEVAIVRSGRLIEQEKISVLRQRAVRHVEVQFATSDAPAPPSGLTTISQSALALRATWAGEVSPLIEWLSRCKVSDVSIAPPDLEDLFLAYYSRHDSQSEQPARAEPTR